MRTLRTGRNLSPILEDVHQGSGGIAGGKFTNGKSDTLPIEPNNYVVTQYLQGQGAYIFEDL